MPEAVDTKPKKGPPQTASVARLDRKHPYWLKKNAYWEKYDLLSKGGDAIQVNAAQFLHRRPKELQEVYDARLKMFTHQPILGPALGWYQSALFRKDPSIDIRLRTDVDPAKMGDDRKLPYNTFLQNCDRNRTTYIDLWRQVYRTMLLFKGAYILIDLPGKNETTFGNLKEQKVSGALDPYLVLYDPRQVINWELDSFGVMKWLVIRSTVVERDFLGDGVIIDRWHYYDRADFCIYERRKQLGSDEMPVTIFEADGSAAGTEATLIDFGPHALSGHDRVPAHYLTVPDDLHIANRVFLPSVAHINIQNSYHWALFMANLPVPVVSSDDEFQHTIGETAVIKLEKGGSFAWSEPIGTSFERSAQCLSELREEIYRSIYLMAQGRSSTAQASAASGYSKELDMLPSQDVLSGLGDIIRPKMQSVLADVALVREDLDIDFDVRGFTFETSPALEEAETFEVVMGLEIPSNELMKQGYKRVAAAYLTDANRAIQQLVNDEIDAAPTLEEKKQAELDQMKVKMKAALGAAGEVALQKLIPAPDKPVAAVPAVPGKKAAA